LTPRNEVFLEIEMNCQKFIWNKSFSLTKISFISKFDIAGDPNIIGLGSFTGKGSKKGGNGVSWIYGDYPRISMCESRVETLKLI
jgi:hypothetical protein